MESNMSKKQNTPEQLEILNCKIDKDEVIAVQAYAGAGKTYILTELARRLQRIAPTWKILYLAFNKDIVEEAKTKFPRNVTVVTTHSLANSAVGRPYFKANKVGANVRKTAIRNACMEHAAAISSPRNSDHPGHNWCRTNQVSWAISNLVWDILHKFLYSGDAKIDNTHIETYRRSAVDNIISDDLLVDMARNLWERMQDLEDSFPMVHDGYLKLYELSRPRLDKQFQVVLLDEAQDANGATMSIMENAQCCRVYVGDPHQQVYSWRGSINAFEKIAETQTQSFRLSQSFRFSQKVAQWATAILRPWKQEEIPVKGTDTRGTVYALSKIKPGDKPPHTYIARTNSSIFAKAVACLDKEKFGFAGKKPNQMFADLLDVYFLWAGHLEKMKNTYYKNFKQFDSLQAYAAQAEDYEVSSLCNLVSKHMHEIPTLVERIMSESVPENTAQIVLTTGHRSKGREWPYVELSADFLEAFRDPEKRSEPGTAVKVSHHSFSKKEEANLLYVAITRAQYSAFVPQHLLDMIKAHYKAYDDQQKYPTP